MSKYDGYIPISRKLFEHPFWRQKRVFSYAEAWIDLISMARYEDSPIKMIIRNQTVEINRGEAPVSIRYLGERWSWSKNKVVLFLEKLTDDFMIKIGTAKGTTQTVLTICNYDTYNSIAENEGQQKGQERDSKGTVKGQWRDKTNKDNKVNKDIIDNNSLLPVSNDTKSNIDFKGLQECFNKMFAGKLPMITTITEKRKSAIKARISEHGKQSVMDVFNKVLESSFLLGGNNKNWKCDFDWIFKPTNFIKILEGNYINKQNGRNDRETNQETKKRELYNELHAISSGEKRTPTSEELLNF